MFKNFKRIIKKTPKKFMTFTLVIAMLVSYFTPILTVLAASNTNKLTVSFRNGSVGRGEVQYSLDNGEHWNNVTNNITEQGITVTGTNLYIRINPYEGYEVDYTGIGLRLDDDNYSDLSGYGFENENGYVVESNIEEVRLTDVEFREAFPGGAGGEEPNYDRTAHVNLTILGTEIENPYGDDASEIRFSINDDHFTALDPANVTYVYETVGNEERIYSVATNNTMDIGYHDISQDSIIIGLRTQWNTFLTDIIVNNVSYDDQLPSNKNELIEAYDHQELRIFVEVPKDENDNYNIVVEGRKQHDNEMILGNFLWDYNEQGYTSEEDKIFHSTLQFIRAEYDNHVYETVEELNAAGSLYNWRDAERKEVYTNEFEGVGEATFPVGTLLTVGIIPDAGYQLVSFGVNEGGFEPQNEIGVYTFEIQGGNFHLQAHVTDVANEVNAEHSNSINNGSIVFGGNENSMAIGTARLDIEDNNNLSNEQVTGFEGAANGYEVNGVFDVSLYNTVFKGSPNASWDTQVDELDNDATITLDLAENMNGKDIVVIHEAHNGSEVTGYDVLDVVYNEENNTITFETDSFSNYAIATKASSETTKYTVHFETNGGSQIADKVVTAGTSVAEPDAPSKDGLTFDGWYEDATFTTSFDFNKPISANVTLYAKWVDNRNKEYTVNDNSGNTIVFKEEEGHTYTLSIIDYLHLTDEELTAAGISKEEYNSVLEGLKKAVKDSGDLVGFFGIEVTNEGGFQVHESPNGFKIKIKMTDEMKKYNTFKIIYVDMDNNLATEKPIVLTQEGDYLVGTLEHLSTYALAGSITTNPKTFDNINIWYGIMAISVLGLLVGAYTTRKNKLVK